MNFGLDEEEYRDEAEKEKKTEQKPAEKKRPVFAYWEVGGNEYKLKLNTSTICRLEDKFKKNLLDILSTGGVPPLAIMLTITQGAMAPWHHKIRFSDVQNLFDKYCEEGGTQLSFMTDVLLPIYSVSGFFSEDQQMDLDQKLEEAKEGL